MCLALFEYVESHFRIGLSLHPMHSQLAFRCLWIESLIWIRIFYRRVVRCQTDVPTSVTMLGAFEYVLSIHLFESNPFSSANVLVFCWMPSFYPATLSVDSFVSNSVLPANVSSFQNKIKQYYSCHGCFNRVAVLKLRNDYFIPMNVSFFYSHLIN